MTGLDLALASADPLELWSHQVRPIANVVAHNFTLAHKREQRLNFNELRQSKGDGHGDCTAGGCMNDLR